MSDDVYRQMAAGNNQIQRSNVERPADTLPTLTEEMAVILRTERDAEIARLRARANELETLSAEGFLKEHGIDVDTVQSFDLAGRMAKRGWRMLSWSSYEGGWKAWSLGWEGSVSRQEVERMLSGEPRQGKP